jgi:N-acetylglutamate synthase-like GNAT family acetyltransferase
VDGLVLRRAETADADAVQRLVNDAFTKYLRRMDRLPAPMTADYSAVLADSRTWAVERDGTIVAVIVTEVHPDHLYVDTIAVASGEQGAGHGRRLLAHAEADARSLGLPELRLYTNEVMTENLEFYPRLGFHETHRAIDRGYHRVYFSKPVSAAV